MSQKFIDIFREKFRHNLNGWWGSTETFPMGNRYHFRPDGTGTIYEHSGFGCTELSFEWRPVGDFCIDWKIYHEDDADYDDEEEQEEDEWERLEYDIIQTKRDGWMLCTAAAAALYKENRSSVSSGSLGIYGCDGPVIRIGD